MHGLLNHGRGIDGRSCRRMNISAFNAISPSRAFGQYMRRTLPIVAALPCVRYMDHSLSTSKVRDGARMLSYPQASSTGLWTNDSTDAKHRSDLHLYTYLLTPVLRSMLRWRAVKRIARGRCLVLLGVLCIVGTMPANAVTQTDLLKLYAHSRIINYQQTQCFITLIERESHWNVKAKNGSHYGLGQMRNTKYKKLDGFTQVDWSIRYIDERYGSMCNAWRHFKAKGWH